MTRDVQTQPAIASVALTLLLGSLLGLLLGLLLALSLTLTGPGTAAAGQQSRSPRPEIVPSAPSGQTASGRSTGVAFAAGGLLVLTATAVAVLADRARWRRRDPGRRS